MSKKNMTNLENKFLFLKLIGIANTYRQIIFGANIDIHKPKKIKKRNYNILTSITFNQFKNGNKMD